MSIDSIVFENGIFYCREFGNLTAEDAQLWAEKAAEFAKEYAPKPIVALVDAREPGEALVAVDVEGRDEEKVRSVGPLSFRAEHGHVA